MIQRKILFAFFALSLAHTVHAADGRLDPKIFEGAPAQMAPDIFGSKQKTDGVLRLLTVDERVGYERKNELVRVPVFFHAAEASTDPNAYVITPSAGGTPVPYQADDIRRDASGKIARMHLYFIIDQLPAWGRRQFKLAKGVNPGAKLPPMTAAAADGKVAITSEGLRLTFHTEGALAGAIAKIETPIGKVNLPDGNLGPSANIIRQPANAGKASRENQIGYSDPSTLVVKDLAWATGPIFGKVTLKIAPAAAPEDIAEYVYMIPRFGSEFIQTQKLHPEEADTIETVGTKSNALLQGKIFVGETEADQEIIPVPAGLRRDLRNVFKFTNKALVNSKSGISMAMIPYAQMGAKDVKVEDNGLVSFYGSGDFQTRGGSNSQTLRWFWGQVRFVFSKATDLESLWHQSCKSFQPLTAVVDEPWATPAAVADLAREVGKEYWKIKYWGRSFEANLVLDYLGGKDVSKMLEGGTPSTSGKMPDIRSSIPTQEAIAEAWKKGQGAGSLDPYGITYSSSAVVPFSAFMIPSSKLDAMAYRLGQASRIVNEQNTPEGFPNIRNFANTANMKIGTYLCALWGGTKYGDLDLARWARDAATCQNLIATYGHGQRPYNMSVGVMEASDVLYISITDMWLRAMELVGNEDLFIHPSVYGRYFDMVDVNADIYQRRFTQNKETKEWSKTSEPSWWRATFLRGQSHDHRWEAYGCDPFLGMLGKASDKGAIGVTETCYFLQKEIGRPQTWNSLMTDVFVPAVLATKGIQNYQPAARLPLPTNISVSDTGGKNTVTWQAVPGAVGYRIYRAYQVGGPWKWLNSPYANMERYTPPSSAQKGEWQSAANTEDEAKAKGQGTDVKKLKKDEKSAAWKKMPEILVPRIPDTLVKTTTFTDPDGAPGAVYFVTAEDKAGRESRWFPDEPLPPSSN